MRKWRKLTVPGAAHPLVRQLFMLMNDQQMGQLDLAERTGINKNTLKDWRVRTVPAVDNLEACLNVLGYQLKITKRKQNRNGEDWD